MLKYFRYNELNKSIEVHFTCFDIFHFLTTIKFKIQYMAHIVFILESTGLEYCEKRDKKGDLLEGERCTTVGVLISQKMAHRHPAPGASGKDGSGS